MGDNQEAQSKPEPTNRRKRKRSAEPPSDDGEGGGQNPVALLLLARLHPDVIAIILAFAQSVSYWPTRSTTLVAYQDANVGGMGLWEDELFLTHPRYGLVSVIDMNSDENLYTWHTRLPGCKLKSKPTAICVDARQIYLVDAGTETIKVYARPTEESKSRLLDSAPEFLAEWTIEINNEFEPYAICMDEQKLYISFQSESSESTTIRAISKEDGRLIPGHHDFDFGAMGESIATDGGDHIFVGNHEDNSVEVRSKHTGERVGQFGGIYRSTILDEAVNREQDLSCPRSIVIFGDQVFVSDYQGFVAVFDRDSHRLCHKITLPADARKGDYWSPTHLLIHRTNLLVFDASNRRIIKIG